MAYLFDSFISQRLFSGYLYPVILDGVNVVYTEVTATLVRLVPEIVTQVVGATTHSAVRGAEEVVALVESVSGPAGLILEDLAITTRDNIVAAGNATVVAISYTTAVHNIVFLGPLTAKYPGMVGESAIVPVARLQTWLRTYIMKCAERIAYGYVGHAKLRSQFRKLQWKPNEKSSSNPHAYHALARSSARVFCKELAKTSGCTIVKIRKPENGAHNPNLDTPNPLFVLVDADYYLQEWQLLDLLSRGPVIMYTYLLDRLGHTGDQGEFRFSKGVLTASYTGGGVYKHRLWDWSMDRLIVTGSWYSTITANVDSKPVHDVCRGMVLLTPTQHLPWPAYHAAKTLYHAPLLSRLMPKVVIDRPGELFVESLLNGPRVSLLMNRTTHFQLDLDTYLNLVSAAKQTQHLSVSTILRETKDERVYLLKEIFKAASQAAIEPDYSSVHFIPIFSDLLDETKEGGSVITKAVIAGGLFPAASLASDRAGVAGRCEDTRCPDKPVVPDIIEYSAEFRDHLVKRLGSLRPKTIEEILETCPSKDYQKWVRADNAYVIPEKLHKTFMKIESYPEVKDPRDIKDVPKTLVLRLSAFVHSYVAALKLNVKWYGFGHSTRKIARRVMRVCTGRTRVFPTDFSRFDGTQGEFLFTEFVKDLYALFPAEYHAEIDSLFKQLHDKLHVTKFGHIFMVLYAMMSGSADTSCRNTIHNARSNYITLRRSGLSPEEAWERLGLYGGDDGLTDYPDPDVAKKTMAELGLKLKIEEITAPTPVPFLGRIYFSPWDRPNSCHEISRAANKLHLSPHNKSNIDPREMAWRKAVSLWVTDSQTPVLNVWARTVLRLVPNGTWAATWMEKVFPNFPLNDGEKYLSQRIMESWPEPIYIGPTLEDAAIALASFLEVEGIDADAYDHWVDAMDNANSFEEFPEPLKIVDFVTLTGMPNVVSGQLSGDKMRPADRIVCMRYLQRKPCPAFCPDHHPKQFCFDFLNSTCSRPSCRYPHIAYNQRFVDAMVERRPHERQTTRLAPLTTSGPSSIGGSRTSPKLSATIAPIDTKITFTRKGRSGKSKEDSPAPPVKA